MGAIPIWAKLLVVALILGCAYAYGHHRGVASTELKHKAALADAQKARIKEYEDQLVDARVKQAASEARSAALSNDLTALQGEQQKLQTALSRARLVIREPSSVPGEPPIVRLSPALRVCLNASATGAASARADCEAFGVPQPGTAAAPNH